MANLKGEAKVIAKQDGQNFAVTVDTLQSFMRADPYDGHLIPKTDVAYDIGSPSIRWRDIYLSGNSLHLGGIVLTDDGQGRLHVENEENPNQEVSFDLSTSVIGDLKDVNTSGVTDGQILKWNPDNQQWMASDEVSSSLKFHGVIGTESGETLVPLNDEVEGDFYLVHGTHTISGWTGIADGTEVNSQDMVVRGATDFSLLTGIIGGGGSGVTTIVSETDALVVDSTLPAAPKLSILNVTETEDGLMASEDKVRLDELSAGQTDVNFDYISPSTVGTDFSVADQNKVHIVRDPDANPTSGVVFDWNRQLDSNSFVLSDKSYSMVPAADSFGLGAQDNPFAYLYADTVNANKYDISSYLNINPNSSSQPFVKVSNFLPKKADGTDDSSQPFGLVFDIDRANSHKNQVKVITRLGDVVKISGGTRPTIEFGTNFANSNGDVGSGEENGVMIKGVITPDSSSPDSQVANKGYVDSVGASNHYHKDHKDSAISISDGLSDIVAPEVLIATEDENYLQTHLMELAFPCWPKKDHPLYNIIPQDYMLMMRMYEGSKKADPNGNEDGHNNETLDADDYGNDNLKNLFLFHIPTGKIKDISYNLSHGVAKMGPARGLTLIPRDNGDVDIYMWPHNPMRSGVAQPLFRVKIAANADPSNPFAGVSQRHTNIKCDYSLFTTPDTNPYNDNTSKKYQYEISQVAWQLVDSMTGDRHYYMMSYNKGSNDRVTQRLFEIHFDESDPDEGSITPVAAHPDSTHGDFAAGWHAIKKDINGVFRCFLFGSPCGLTELYFKGDRNNRTSEMRNYGDYIPLGDRVTHDTATNGIGQPLIIGKGIVDNWFKNTTLAIQFLTQESMDPDDYFSNILVYYQSGYGVVSINVADLGVIDRNEEVHLVNNFVGTVNELSSLLIEEKTFYMSYIQDASSKNLMRFNSEQPDTHSHGSVWFFDYKEDYRFDTTADGGISAYAEEQSLYNGTRTGTAGNDGKDQVQLLFKRPILEVRPNYKTNQVEVQAVLTGYKHHPSGVEVDYHENFSGESVTKMFDTFVCSGASKSHSSITEPRMYIFNPMTRKIQRISNTNVNSTSLMSVPDHGLVIGASYGIDRDDNNTPIHMTSMIADNKVIANRVNARTLRKLYAVTGDDVASDPNTWTEDAPQTGVTTPDPTDFDSDQDEWDPQV